MENKISHLKNLWAEGFKESCGVYPTDRMKDLAGSSFTEETKEEKAYLYGAQAGKEISLDEAWELSALLEERKAS